LTTVSTLGGKTMQFGYEAAIRFWAYLVFLLSGRVVSTGSTAVHV
jgi:hypothetical protein